MESILAIIGIFFLPIAMIIFIVWVKSSERRKLYQLQAELYAKALEKGQPLQADLFVELKEPKKKGNPLKTGLVCISAGIGIALFVWLFVFTGFDDLKADAVILFRLIGSLGIIPFVIGIAYVIIHFIEKKKAANDNAQ